MTTTPMQMTMTSPSSDAGREAARPGRGPGLRVLLVEDNLVNQVVAAEMLAAAGHEVTIASDGVEGVAAAARGGFDIILMDVQMPEMDGITATASIRARERATGLRVPIVAITANVTSGDERRCLAAGMDAYLTKPVRPGVLLETLERHGRATSSVATGVYTFDDRVALERLGGDESLLAGLVDVFLDAVPLLMQELGNAIAREDAEEIEFAAHAMKGSVSYIEMGRAHELAYELETIGASGEVLRAGEAFGRLLEALDPLLEELDRRRTCAPS